MPETNCPRLHFSLPRTGTPYSMPSFLHLFFAFSIDSSCCSLVLQNLHPSHCFDLRAIQETTLLNMQSFLLILTHSPFMVLQSVLFNAMFPLPFTFRTFITSLGKNSFTGYVPLFPAGFAYCICPEDPCSSLSSVCAPLM